MADIHHETWEKLMHAIGESSGTAEPEELKQLAEAYALLMHRP